MMQSILLPAASSQAKEGAISAKSSKTEDLSSLDIEGQEKKNSTDFASLLDALLPGEEIQGQQKNVSENMTARSDSGDETLSAQLTDEPGESDLILSKDDAEANSPLSEYSTQLEGNEENLNLTDSIAPQLVTNAPALNESEDISDTSHLQDEPIASQLVSEQDENEEILNLNDSESDNIASQSIISSSDSDKNKATVNNIGMSIASNPTASRSSDFVSDDNQKVEADRNKLKANVKIVDNAVDSPASMSPEKTKQATDILADIEDAQKINTQINQPEKSAASTFKVSELFHESESKKETVSKKEGAVSDELEKILLKENISGKEKVVLEEQVKVEQVPKLTEKAEQLLSSKIVDRPPLSTLTESNQVRPFNSGTSDLNKVATQTQSMNPTSNTQTTLSDSLALQTKQSAALLGERVLMMLAKDKKEIQIRLDPAELGSMNIKLQVQQDQVQLTIQAQTGQTRELLEQNLPRLREQLAQQGVNLGETNIEQQNQNNQQNQHTNKALQQGGQVNGEQTAVTDVESEAWLAREINYSTQGIDYYA